MKTTVDQIPDALFRHQQKLEYFSLFLLIFAFAINLDNIRSHKIWDDVFFIVMIGIVALIFIACVWIRVQKLRAKNLTRQIKRDALPKGPSREAVVEKLSTRQKEIFELIMLRMSNREIMEELSLEQRAFKTHVYRIYKIQNRVRRTGKPV